MSPDQLPRGIVVCPTVTLEGKRFSFDCSLDAQEVRRYLLYWDRIAYAFANGMGKPNLDSILDLQFMRNCGVLTLHDTRVGTADVGRSALPRPLQLSEAASLFSAQTPTQENPTGMALLGLPVSIWPDLNYFAPLRTASLLQADGNALWTVAQTRSAYIFPSGNAERTHLFEATLYAALPVPTAETPLDEIIAFREARQPELLRLRHAIDGLHRAILEAEDTRRALEFARNDLLLSLQDLHKALNVSLIRTFFSTLRLYLNLSDTKLVTTLLGAFGAEGVGLPLEVGAAVGLGANTLLTFATRVLDRPVALPSELNDFMYLYDVHKYWAGG